MHGGGWRPRRYSLGRWGWRIYSNKRVGSVIIGYFPITHSTVHAKEASLACSLTLKDNGSIQELLWCLDYPYSKQ